MLQIPIDVVLDQGDAAIGAEVHQAFLVRIAQARAGRVTEVCTDQTRRDFAPRATLQCGFERFDAQPVARMGWYLECLQAQVLQNLQDAVEHGGLERHAVTGAGHAAQCEIQRFRATVGHDDFIGCHAASKICVTAQQLAS